MINDIAFVTGAHGFVGQNLVEYLGKSGVIAISNTRDLTSKFTLPKGVRVVYHLAGRVRGILGNLQNQEAAYRVNTLINTHVVEACIRAGVEKVVAMGTVAMFPDTTDKIYESDLWAASPHSSEYGYAQAKRGMLAHLEVSGLKWAMPIATNMYGPHDRFNVETGHVVASLIAKFHAGDPVVWGDGSATRDFLHVHDAVRALVTIMERGDGPVTLASGESRRIGEVVEVLAEKTGRTVTWDASKPVGHRQRSYDVTRLASLGFKPEIPLADGLRQTFDWYDANRAIARK